MTYHIHTYMKLLYTIFAVMTAMVGYTIHGNLFWSIMDFFFVPIVWAKWLVFHEVNMTIIRQTFTWFFQ